MAKDVAYSLAALASLVPVQVAVWRPTMDRDGRPPLWFWATLALAVVGPLLWLAGQLSGADWPSGLAATLWVTVAGTALIFACVSLLHPAAWRLTPLLMPYLLLLGILGTAALWAPRSHMAQAGQAGLWLVAHITVSVATYALVTLAAVAGLATSLQMRALKRKQPTAWTRALPPLMESETLEIRFLVAAETVLAAGLITGMTVLFYESGFAWRFDHKSSLSILAFVLIGALLVAHMATGTRGRTVARMALTAYLLLTLAYPGVKFVRDVLLAGG